jgi:hypothetical protein
MGKETVKTECDIKEQAESSHAGLHGVVGSVEKQEGACGNCKYEVWRLARGRQLTLRWGVQPPDLRDCISCSELTLPSLRQ